MNPKNNGNACGYLLVNKPKGKTSFSLVSMLRRHLGIRTIGHAGTLDPLASGVMVMLLGREYTKLSDRFLAEDKEYLAELHFGVTTDSYDSEGQEVASSQYVPTIEELEIALKEFQGEIMQIPPMFSAKKINGQKLYHLARQGKTVERAPVKVNVDIELLSYAYPLANLRINCSKGTYIRSIAHDLGIKLGCGAHLSNLIRSRSGKFLLNDCIDGEQLYAAEANVMDAIRRF